MSEISEKIGRRIAALRASAAMTQEALAERIGTTAQVVSKMERGAIAPSVERLAEIAVALAVEPRELLAFDAPPERSGAGERDRIAKRLAQIAGGGTIEDARTLLRVAEAMFARPSAARGRGRPRRTSR